MLLQIQAILWAQGRTFRNRLPRTPWGSILAGILGLLWYGLFVAVGVALTVVMPELPLVQLRGSLPAGLLGVFLFWQVVPLFTLSTGWSLQLNKLQVYPISNSAFFGIEVLLRITTAPEMIFVVLGGFCGLLRHPAIAIYWPFLVLLFIPINLFFSLAIREVVLHSFEKNRFRELFAILLISISILPQIVLRTGVGRKLSPYFFSVAHHPFSPWQSVAALGLGSITPVAVICVLVWLAVSYGCARWLFVRSLHVEDTLRAPSLKSAETSKYSNYLAALLSRFFHDPMAALLQKEIQTLVRMPRFRVTFGMACVFSVLVFLPIAWNSLSHNNNSFMRDNFLSVVTLYGLLILSDLLLLNIFGLDRSAAQVYFVAPIPFSTVIKVKNITAALFMLIQSGAVLVVVAMVRVPITAFHIVSSVMAAAVVGIFFVSAGNLSSVMMARPSDPKQTFRKQAGGKMQLWLLLCSLGMFLLLGSALLAEWAFGSQWALLGVLTVELVIGLIVYHVALDTAMERSWRDREQLLDALAKGSSPIGLGG